MLDDQKREIECLYQVTKRKQSFQTSIAGLFTLMENHTKIIKTSNSLFAVGGAVR